MTTDLSQQLYSTAQIRTVEQRAINDLNIPGFTLMSRAGAAVVDYLQTRLNNHYRILVLCGPGNNGGDGFVVAALMMAGGYHVDVVTVLDPATLKGDAALARDQWQDSGGQTMLYDGSLPDADVIVDALFGIGLHRDITGEYRALVQQINTAAARIISVDIPSGVCSDTGSVRGVAVVADVTITFIGYKQGQWLHDGPDYCGELLLYELDVPAAAFPPANETIRLLDDSDIAMRLPGRQKKNCHKGDFGHVCLIGGGAGMPGAVILAGEAAARSGAGLVTVATSPEHAASLAAACPVLMLHAVSDARDLRNTTRAATVLAIGPGLGQDHWAQALFADAIETALPLVIDADALNLLAHNPRRSEHQILTPHPGEAARLLDMPTAEIQADRVTAIRLLQDKFSGVIVLKGAGTLIYDGQRMFLCAAGNPGMSSGGMGDLLTGIIAALVAQGLALSDAAVVAVQAHAQAGDKATKRKPRGLIATDLFPYLRETLNP